jgi:hypothetical protein
MCEVVQTPNKIAFPGPASNGRVQGCIQNQLGLLIRRQLTKVPQKLEEAQIPGQVGFADAPKHEQVGL